MQFHHFLLSFSITIFRTIEIVTKLIGVFFLYFSKLCIILLCLEKSKMTETGRRLKHNLMIQSVVYSVFLLNPLTNICRLRSTKFFLCFRFFMTLKLSKYASFWRRAYNFFVLTRVLARFQHSCTLKASLQIFWNSIGSFIFSSEGFVVSTFRQTLRLTTLKIYY